MGETIVIENLAYVVILHLVNEYDNLTTKQVKDMAAAMGGAAIDYCCESGINNDVASL